MDIKAIHRVAQYMGMVLAHIELVDECNARPGVDAKPKEPDNMRCVFHFSGSGASDMLMLSDVKAFVEEVNLLREIGVHSQGLAVLADATKTAQDRAGAQIESALGAIAKLSKVLQQVAPAETQVNEQVELVTEFALEAYRAMDDGFETLDGTHEIARENVERLTNLMEKLDKIAVAHEIETQAFDGRAIIRGVRSLFADPLKGFDWVEYDPLSPMTTLPRETGRYLVECYDPGQGPNFNGEPEYPESTYWHICDVSILFGENGEVHDSDFTVVGVAGDFDWDRDVTRYAKIPVFTYRTEIAKDDEGAQS